MSEIHNISDLQRIRFLFRELQGVKQALLDAYAYDCTESLGDCVRILTDREVKTSNACLVAQTDMLSLNQRIHHLETELHALRLEKINEDMAPKAAAVDFGECIRRPADDWDFFGSPIGLGGL